MLRRTIIRLMEIAIIFDVVVHEIGCKQAVNRTANEFILERVCRSPRYGN